MKAENKYCQSCGMPMKHDPQGGSRNADGSQNHKYCSYCYVDGKFTFEGTMEEFQEHTRQILRSKGKGFMASRFGAWLFTRGLGRLERWKK